MIVDYSINELPKDLENIKWLAKYGEGDKKHLIGLTNDKSGVEEILIKDKLSPVFDIKIRCYAMFGPSGSGKSYYASMLIESYKKLYDGEVYLVSGTDDDPTFDSIEMNIVEDPLTIDPQDSLVVLDDIEGIKEFRDVQKVLLNRGRHTNTGVISTNHMLLEGNTTKPIIQESPMITIYCQSGQNYQIRTFLERYVGLGKKLIDQVMKIDSRWITVHKNYPICVMHEHGIFMTSKYL